MAKKEAKYLKEYKNLSMLEKLKYNFSKNLFTGAPLKKTVDDFQNLMRHCRCSDIADKVNILFKTKYMEAQNFSDIFS